MTKKEFDEKFTVNPKKDIEPFMTCISSTEANFDNQNIKCANCGDSVNIDNYPSIPWTAVFYCRSCQKMNVVHEQDRMAGIQTDPVFIYQFDVLNPPDILYKRYDETDEEFKARVKEVHGIED